MDSIWIPKLYFSRFPMESKKTKVLIFPKFLLNEPLLNQNKTFVTFDKNLYEIHSQYLKEARFR